MNKNESSLRSDKRDCRVSRWIDGYIRYVRASAGRRVKVLPMALLHMNCWDADRASQPDYFLSDARDRY